MLCLFALIFIHYDHSLSKNYDIFPQMHIAICVCISVNNRKRKSTFLVTHVIRELSHQSCQSARNSMWAWQLWVNASNKLLEQKSSLIMRNLIFQIFMINDVKAHLLNGYISETAKLNCYVACKISVQKQPNWQQHNKEEINECNLKSWQVKTLKGARNLQSFAK